ncbi:MAG: VOC family protein, partial [Solirubrobacterales bacterium]
MPLSRMEHVLVLTDDIDASRDFYRDALGLEVGDRPPLEFPGYWLYAEGVPCVHVAERAAYTAHSATLGITASPPAAG